MLPNKDPFLSMNFVMSILCTALESYLISFPTKRLNGEAKEPWGRGGTFMQSEKRRICGGIVG